MKKIIAKFPSFCHETGEKIKKGESIIYDYATKKVYSKNSKKYQQFTETASIENNRQDNETRSLNGYIQAQEDAFFQSGDDRNRY